MPTLKTNEIDELFKVLEKIMYGKVVNLKFANMEEAKLAASFFTEILLQKFLH